MEVTGLDRFIATLDKRRDIEGRDRGLLTGIYPQDDVATPGSASIANRPIQTVSNHVSVYVIDSA